MGGAAQSITGTATLNARFTGQWFQLDASLHYNWHRHYDSTLGRYTQPDPLGFVDGPSVYGYVRGAPQSYVDPDGRIIWIIPRLIISYCERNPVLCQLILKEVLRKTACLLVDFWNDEQGGRTSSYKDVSKGNSVNNRETDINRSDFEKGLTDNNFVGKASQDGKTTVYTKSDGSKYVVRSDKPSVDFYQPGSRRPDLKIRLKAD